MSPETSLITSGFVLAAVLLYWIFKKRTEACLALLAALVCCLLSIGFHKAKTLEDKLATVTVSDVPTLQSLKVGMYQYSMSYMDNDGSNIVMLYPLVLKEVDDDSGTMLAIRTTLDPLMVRVRYVYGLTTNSTAAHFMAVTKKGGTNIISVFDFDHSSVAQVN